MTAQGSTETVGLRSEPDLGRHAAHSGAIQVGSQALLLAMAIVTGIVLARLLTPEDFGIMAMAATLTGFVSSLRGFGFSMALVHADTITPESLQRLFAIAARYALLLAAGMVVASPVLAAAYEEPRLLVVVPVLTIGTALVSLADMPEALAMRELRFVALRRVEVGSTAVGLVASIVAAWLGAGYWALVLQGFLTSSFRGIWTWRLVAWRPVMTLSAGKPESGAGEAVRYAHQYSATTIITYVAQNIDRVTVGISAGPHAMGLYDNAYRWGLYPVHQLYPPLLNVAVAGLSRTRHDVDAYRHYWRTAMLLVLSAMLPAIAFFAVESESTILTLLGARWEDAAPVFRLVTIGALAVALSRHSRWLFLSEGRTRSQLKLSIVQLLIMLVTVGVGARWGLIGVAAAVVVCRWILLIPELSLAFSESRIRWSDFLAVVWRPATATALAATALLAAGPELPSHPAVRLATGGLIFGGLYLTFWLALPGGMRSARGLAGVARRMKPAES